MNKFYKRLLSEIVIQSVPQLLLQIGEGVREYVRDRRLIKIQNLERLPLVREK